MQIIVYSNIKVFRKKADSKCMLDIVGTNSRAHITHLLLYLCAVFVFTGFCDVLHVDVEVVYRYEQNSYILSKYILNGLFSVVTNLSKRPSLCKVSDIQQQIQSAYRNYIIGIYLRALSGYRYGAPPREVTQNFINLAVS